MVGKNDARYRGGKEVESCHRQVQDADDDDE